MFIQKMGSDEEKEGRDDLFRFKKGLISYLKTKSLEAVLAEVRRLNHNWTSFQSS